MRDPYTILGLTKKADAAQVKKAFRTLAKKYHPDQSKEPKAKEKFAEVSAAYEILGDEAKRGQFDRGEIDAEGKPKFQGFPGGGRPGGPGAEHFEFNMGGGSPFGRGRGSQAGAFDPSDLFADLFGGGGPRRASGGAQRSRGEDVAASVSVSLGEADAGTTTRVTLPTGRTLEINVPAGMEDGKQIRLKGQGHASPMGGEAGDALITVRIKQHPHLRVDGADLRLDLPITLYEAVLGASITVPTLHGAVELAIPPGTNGGRTLRLRGKGLSDGKGGKGDQLVTLRVILPPQDDAKLADLMREWQANKPYDPRKDM